MANRFTRLKHHFISLSTIAALSIGTVFAVAGAHQAAAVEMSPAVKAVVDYDKSGEVPKTKYRIAYLTECVDNPYCLARLAGLKEAAEKYGFDFKIFDANFSPATQAKVVENAVTEGFDGYLFGPAAAQPGCGLYNRLLKPTGKPVVSIDIAMCGDPDYTEGLAATLTMQGPAHFNEFLENAFASCTDTCEVAAVGGFVGSDLFTYWEEAIKKAAAKHPNVQGGGRRAGQLRSAHRAEEDPGRAARPSRHQHDRLVLGRHVPRRRAGGDRRRQDPGRGRHDLLRRSHQGRRRQGQGRRCGPEPPPTSPIRRPTTARPR